MLQRTNVFPKDVSELKYASAWHEEDISLLGCVEDEIKKYNHRFRGRSERNLQIVYRCIGAAMAVYIESYPAAFSFKQRQAGSEMDFAEPSGERQQAESGSHAQ